MMNTTRPTQRTTNGIAACYRTTRAAAREIRRASSVVAGLPAPVGGPLRKRARALRVSAARTLRILRGRRDRRAQAPDGISTPAIGRRVDLLARSAHDLHAEAVFLSTGPPTTSVEALAETAAKAAKALGIGSPGSPGAA